MAYPFFVHGGNHLGKSISIDPQNGASAVASREVQEKFSKGAKQLIQKQFQAQNPSLSAPKQGVRTPGHTGGVQTSE